MCVLTYKHCLTTSSKNMGYSCKEPPLCVPTTLKSQLSEGLYCSQEHGFIHQQMDVTTAQKERKAWHKEIGWWPRRKTFSTVVSWSRFWGNEQNNSVNCGIKQQSREAAKCMILKAVWYMDVAMRMWLHWCDYPAVWAWLCGCGCNGVAVQLWGHSSTGPVVPGLQGKQPREPMSAELPLMAFKLCCMTAAIVIGHPAFKGKELSTKFSIRRMPSAPIKRSLWYEENVWTFEGNISCHGIFKQNNSWNPEYNNGQNHNRTLQQKRKHTGNVMETNFIGKFIIGQDFTLANGQLSNEILLMSCSKPR